VHTPVLSEHEQKPFSAPYLGSQTRRLFGISNVGGIFHKLKDQKK
jgi:hypothetical protein